MIYLDNGSTTSVDPDVIKIMVNVMQRQYGNPSSLHELGMQAEKIVEKSRELIAKQLRCMSREVLFTSGGTESNNLAIQGIAYQYQSRGMHLITTEVEHESVYGVYKNLEKQGWSVTYLPVDSVGRVNMSDVAKAITDETVLLSVIHVNNEVGTIQPIEMIGEILTNHPKVFYHVDAVQSFGKIPLYPCETNVDLMSISAHKLHGPKGIGCLYKKKNVLLRPLVGGGGQEFGLRSGTENVPGIVGMAKAVQMAAEKQESFLQQTLMWKDLMIRRLTKAFPDIKVNGESLEGGESAPYILSLSFPFLRSEVLVHALEEEGVYVGTKSACSSKRETASRVLLSMGIDAERARGTIRISMGFETTQNDIEKAIEVFERVIPKYQQVTKVSKK